MIPESSLHFSLQLVNEGANRRPVRGSRLAYTDTPKVGERFRVVRRTSSLPAVSPAMWLRKRVSCSLYVPWYTRATPPPSRPLVQHPPG